MIINKIVKENKKISISCKWIYTTFDDNSNFERHEQCQFQIYILIEAGFSKVYFFCRKDND